MMMSPSLSLLLMLVAAFQLTDAAKGQNRITTVPPKTIGKELADATNGRKNIITTPKADEKGVPAKDRDVNLRRASVSSGQTRLPLPPPSKGWIVIMQRFDLSLSFNRNWTEYKNGFGELGLQKEFWLGNEAIHLLTTGVPHKLRIELVANDAVFYADYDSFSLDSEDKKYTLHVSGYSGNAGDSMTAPGGSHDGVAFSTPDADNDKNADFSCSMEAGWWFNRCYYAFLTCPEQNGFGPRWRSLESLVLNGALIGARMRIMRK